MHKPLHRYLGYKHTTFHFHRFIQAHKRKSCCLVALRILQPLCFRCKSTIFLIISSQKSDLPCTNTNFDLSGKLQNIIHSENIDNPLNSIIHPCSAWLSKKSPLIKRGHLVLAQIWSSSLELLYFSRGRSLNTQYY